MEPVDLAEEEFGLGDGQGFASSGESNQQRVEIRIQISFRSPHPGLSAKDIRHRRDPGPESPDRRDFLPIGELKV